MIVVQDKPNFLTIKASQEQNHSNCTTAEKAQLHVHLNVARRVLKKAQWLKDTNN